MSSKTLQSAQIERETAKYNLAEFTNMISDEQYQTAILLLKLAIKYACALEFYNRVEAEENGIVSDDGAEKALRLLDRCLDRNFYRKMEEEKQ